MSLAERLREALERGRGLSPVLLAGDALDEADGEVTPAAVLVAVVERREPTVILTERPRTMRKHPGQISFPGGRIEPEDDGPVGAALREAGGEVDVARLHLQQSVAHAAADIAGLAGIRGQSGQQFGHSGPLLPGGGRELHRTSSSRRDRLTIIAAVAPQMRRPSHSIS